MNHPDWKARDQQKILLLSHTPNTPICYIVIPIVVNNYNEGCQEYGFHKCVDLEKWVHVFSKLVMYSVYCVKKISTMGCKYKYRIQPTWHWPSKCDNTNGSVVRKKIG